MQLQDIARDMFQADLHMIGSSLRVRGFSIRDCARFIARCCIPMHIHPYSSTAYSNDHIFCNFPADAGIRSSLRCSSHTSIADHGNFCIPKPGSWHEENMSRFRGRT